MLDATHGVDDVDDVDGDDPGDDLARALEAASPAAASAFGALAGEAPALRRALAVAARAARSDAPVLLLGETGTGKELVARAVHAASPRAAGPLVTLDCGALPDGLLEAELFGVTRGAFTGAVEDRPGLLEAAHGGTLFLDEVGELPRASQARLLRALAEGEVRALGAARARRVDVRVVAATHRDLRSMARTGAFREDLLFRLGVVVVRLPPLRARGGDVAVIAARLLADLARAAGEPARALSPGARRALEAHAWPGNVRELRNALRRALALAPPGRALEARDLGLRAVRGAPARTAAAAAVAALLVEAEARAPRRSPADAGTVADGARAAVLAALAAEGGHVRRAARRAGLHAATLYRMLQRWGVERR